MAEAYKRGLWWTGGGGGVHSICLVDERDKRDEAPSERASAARGLRALKFLGRVWRACRNLPSFSTFLPFPTQKWLSLSLSGAFYTRETRISDMLTRTCCRICRSMVVTPGEPAVISPPADVRITNVALGDELADESGRTTVKLVYRTPGQGGDSDEEDEDEEDKEEDEDEDKPGQLSTTVLCSLTPGKVCRGDGSFRTSTA